MKRVVPVLACLLLLAGCSSAPAASEPTRFASPTPTKVAQLEVSTETTCTLLLGPNYDGPAAKAADIISRFAANPDGTTVTKVEIDSVRESLNSADETAGETLRPYIAAIIDPLDALSAAYVTGQNSGLDLGDFKAASLELVTLCP
jgi:ABC-type glycerol-3-phosphate transport system substrate-binding protein